MATPSLPYRTADMHESHIAGAAGQNWGQRLHCLLLTECVACPLDALLSCSTKVDKARYRNCDILRMRQKITTLVNLAQISLCGEQNSS